MDCPDRSALTSTLPASPAAKFATEPGEADYLKETVIGVFVFGRKPDFDPKVDTIVRSQVWRLRAKLKKYYAYEGSQDHVIIDLPRGHYVPVFRGPQIIRD
jgi:hypothetical protein